MDDKPLYSQIVESIRQEILAGRYKSGDPLPTVRELTKQWNCTPGTIQRAYHELSLKGLIISRPGKGTEVLSAPSMQTETPLRKAELIHRAEAFLLESLNTGHSPEDIEQAVRTALDRWRVVDAEPKRKPEKVLHFAGSHDLVVTWMAGHFQDIAPGYSMNLVFNGSLSGLMLLAEGKADLAGTHLWDEETDSYNVPFVKKLFPNQSMVLLTLCHRRIGLIFPMGNPKRIGSLRDLIQPNISFINRQGGSGTRVWLDAQLRRLKILPDAIAGYTREALTHNEVAQAIAEGKADTGLGLEGSAHHYGLDFLFLTLEEYDLVITEENFKGTPFQDLRKWLLEKRNRQIITGLGGYVTDHSGDIKYIG